MPSNDNTLTLRQQLTASLAATPRLVAKSSLELRREAELFYDCAVPHDIIAAIETQAREERAGLVRVAPRPEPTLRQRAAFEFAMAKECFRPVIQNAYGPRGSERWRRFRRQQRWIASEHLEAWAGLRRLERKEAEEAA